MSQVISQNPNPQSMTNEFNYRPVPILAPVSLVLGLCAAMALLTAFGLVIAFIGAVLGVIAFLRIRKAEGDLGGLWLAAIGLCLSSIFLVTGTGLQSYSYATELPEGYTRVNFPYGISRKEFVYENGRRQLHPDVQPLVDQNIFIKGWMWNRGKETDLTAFVLLKDNGKCCMGGDPKPFDMILITLPPDEKVDYLSGLISVGGKLKANPNAPYGAPVYAIEATHVEKARTSF